MEKGEIQQRRTIDQVDSGTSEFMEKAVHEMRQLMGESVLLDITTHPLTSEFNPDIIGENMLTILWHNSSPAALSLETRDMYNRTVTQQIFFGPNTPTN